MKKIGVVNHKGGVGKSFFASHLIWGLSEWYDKKVIGMDMDPQENLMKWMGGKDYVPGKPVSGKNFTIYPGYNEPITRITKYWYDTEFVVIDGRPTFEIMPQLLEDLDLCFVPVRGRFSIESAMDMKNLIESIGLPDNLYYIRNMIDDVRPALRKREEYLLAGLNGRVVEGGLILTHLVPTAEHYQVCVWKLKGIGVTSSGIIPFLKKLCDMCIKLEVK